MSYAQSAGVITLTYTLDDLFERTSRETYAIVKNKHGENGPLVDVVALTEDERFFFDDYLETVKDDILSILDKLSFGITDPVSLDLTNLVFKIVDKANYNVSTLTRFDEEIKKAIVDYCIAEWLLKVEQFDLSKVYASKYESRKIKITNLSVELRKPVLN